MHYAAMRREDIPEPPIPSTEYHCQDCGRAVWISNKMIKHAKKCQGILCIQCVLIRENMALK